MNRISLLLLALLLVSCETINGNFQVSEMITLEKGSDNVSIPAGNYKASLRVTTKKVKLDLGDGNKYKFKIDPDAIPRRNGNVFFSASEVGQPYDVSTTVSSDVSESDSRAGRETCSYREAYQVCYPDRQGRTRCHTEYRTVNGYRRVQYRVRTIDKSLLINLFSPGTEMAKASFSGRDISKSRIYEYVGQCY
ncbi:MAG: hypothetical protein KC493_14120 [Bacteriovoracaceae bacterium]|nr:hypothetical protein [Bacteriovoracaceae bacterium]